MKPGFPVAGMIDCIPRSPQTFLNKRGYFQIIFN